MVLRSRAAIVVVTLFAISQGAVQAQMAHRLKGSIRESM